MTSRYLECVAAMMVAGVFCLNSTAVGSVIAEHWLANATAI